MRITVTENQTPRETTTRQRLQSWFREQPGKLVLEMEQRKLNQLFPDLFGYHIIQVGCLNKREFMQSSRISHKVVLRLDEDGDSEEPADLECKSDALCLDADCIDVVFMPHVLEFTENPHRTLREAARILIGDGHLVICGFNPWSLWGVWRFFLVWRELPPWCGHFFGQARLKDWLNLLDFELVTIDKFFYRPPLKNLGVMRRLGFMEKLGNYCWSWFGGAYIIVAKKRVIPMTPIKLSWKEKRRLISSGLVEPSTRTGNS